MSCYICTQFNWYILASPVLGSWYNRLFSGANLSGQMADAITLDWAGRSNVDAAVKHQKLQNYEVPDLVRVSDLNEICRTVGLNQKYQGINVGHTANVEEEFGFAYTPPLLQLQQLALAVAPVPHRIALQLCQQAVCRFPPGLSMPT